MIDEQFKNLITTLLTSSYHQSCDCRKKFGLPFNLHPITHLEDCPYRIKIDNDKEKRKLFYGD